MNSNMETYSILALKVVVFQGKILQVNRLGVDTEHSYWPRCLMWPQYTLLLAYISKHNR